MANMIKVRGLTSAAGSGFSIVPGEEKDLPKDIAEDLIRAGFAEPLKKKAEKTTASRKKTEKATQE